MVWDLVLFVLGIGLIVLGANLLTDGAATLARRLGLSPLMVGLTIVAFGTSAPEVVVSLTSALKGSSDIALGNVIGSNIFNVLAIGGVTAMIRPLIISRSTIRREIPLLVLASVVVLVMTLDTSFGGVGDVRNVISRSEGLVLLGFFCIFLAYTFAISSDGAEGASPAEAEPSEASPNNAGQRHIAVLVLFIVGGLAALVAGGDLFVGSATRIARSMGVSEALIGLTLVAAGTSLPELATSVVAALKGEHELAMGNIVGSGIFNIFLILGLTATVTPIGIGGITVLDMGVLVGSAILLYLLGVFFGQRTITRAEGGLLFAGYLGYTAYLISQI